jgi:DNA polymerase
MGETELVLDGLTVDEALRILGARGGGVGEREAPVGATADWREALRAAGAAPGDLVAGAKQPKPAAPEPSQDPLAAGLTVGTPSAELFGGPMALLDSLDKVAAHVASCTRCPLYSTATNPVPGEGNPNADFMCVGEAPGATEDETGRPFVGAAGQLLTKILGAIDLKREDVYICNVLKHRPPGNRNPRPEEVTACSPYLIRQIELIRPKVILALGTFAAQTLLDTKLSIGKLRGQVHRYYGVPLVVTYHPAALLRNPGWKRPTWEDVQLARRILDSAASTGGA